MPLEYPITREYTVPHLTAYLSFISVAAIAGFTALNVILQGYDVVTVLRPDPNVTQSYWWSTRSFSVRSAGSCNPVSLPEKMTFSTNSSLFSYELRSVFDTNKQNIAGASSYMANPLSSCTVDVALVDIDLTRSTFKFDTLILCTGSELPFSLSLVSTFSLHERNPFYDDIVRYFTQNKPTREGTDWETYLIQRNASSLINVFGVLGAVSSDLQVALWLAGNNSAATPTAISTGGLLTCPGRKNVACKPEEMIMEIPASVLTYPNGSTVSSDAGIGSFLEPAKTSFLNMFTVLRDAYHIDLGNIKPDNTLLSRDAFAARIHPNPILSALAHNVSNFSLCGWGIGCVHDSPWVDQLLASDPNINATIPSILPAGNAPAVVRVDYLCPEFRRKNIGSLITSVFIGTWAVYAALFGVFSFVGPRLEKIYGRRGGGIYHGTEDVDDEHTGTPNPLAQPGWNSQRGDSDTKYRDEREQLFRCVVW